MFYKALLATLLVTAPLYAQDLHIGDGSTFRLDGASLHLAGDWTNDGTFVAGDGTVAFVGATGNQTIGGTSVHMFNNLTVNKMDGNVVLLADIEIDGDLVVVNGSVDLNGHLMSLGDDAEVTETPGNTIKGPAGAVSATEEMNAPQNLNLGGLGAILSSDRNFGETTITRGHAPQNGSGNTSILRYYDISTTIKTGLDATLVIHYDESELNGIPEEQLQYLRSTDGGLTWIAMGGVVDTVNNTITLTGIDAFSMWSLGTSQSTVLADIEQEPIYITGNRQRVPVTETLTISDADDTELEGATITIICNAALIHDELQFTTMHGITGTWDKDSRTLTLSGTATVAEYQEAIKNVKLYFLSPTYPIEPRTVRITLSDGTSESNTVSRTVLLPPAITILSPCSGDVLDAGAQVPITWEADDSGTGTLAFTMDFGMTYHVIDNAIDLTNGLYLWTVPEGSSCGCAIALTSNTELSYTSGTLGYFTIGGDACPVTVNGITSLAGDDDNYLIQMSLGTPDIVADLRFASPFIAWNDTINVIGEHYGSSDSDGDGDIDMVASLSDTVSVGTFTFPADIDSLTIGFYGLFIGDAYYWTPYAESFKVTPEPPVTMTAMSTTDGIEITWEASPDDMSLTGYAIYRSDNDQWTEGIGAPVLVGMIEPGMTSYIDTDPLTVSSFYWVQAVSPLRSSICGPAEYDPGVFVAEETPREFTVSAPYPNPFNPSTTIRFALPRDADVHYSVYSGTGQKVRDCDLGHLRTGSHDFVFDGAGLPTGMYVLRLEAGSSVKTVRMLLMK